MSRANLIERLNFEGTKVYLDGEVIFSGLAIPVDNEINLLGVTQERVVYDGVIRRLNEEPRFIHPKLTRTLFVGCGSCCEGPISILKMEREDEDANEYFKLVSVKLPGFNVLDILPVVFGETDSFDGECSGLLATGYGCNGSGVKLIGRRCSGYLEVVPSQDFRELWNPAVQNWVEPRLTVSAKTGKITLNLLKSGYRLRPGHKRNPNIPGFLIDDNYETYVSQDIHASQDLTVRLVELGVNIAQTVEANEGYVRIRRSK